MMTCPLRTFPIFNIFSIICRSSIVIIPIVEEKLKIVTSLFKKDKK
jgi:hypothetical protein